MFLMYVEKLGGAWSRDYIGYNIITQIKHVKFMFYQVDKVFKM